MLDLTRFRLLVALGARLTLRGYLNNKAALLGVVFLLLVTLPPVLRLTARLGHYSLFVVLAAVFGVLMLLPLGLTALLPGSGDTARLLHYPVTPRTLVAALALGALLDPMVLMLLSPILVGLVARYGLGLVLPLVLLLATALLLGQALLFLGGALARSRRLREGLSLLTPVTLAALLILVNRAPARAATSLVLPASLTPRAFPVLALTPPGLVEQRSVLGGVGLLLWLIGALVVAGWLAKARVGGETERSNGGRPWLSLLARAVGGTVGSIAAKELTYFWREPRLRGPLSRSSVAMVVVGVLTLHPTNAPRVLWDSVLGTGVVLYLLLWLLERACNQWGTESAAGYLLWSFPGKRAAWVLGKNLALFPLLFLCVAFALTEYALLAHPASAALRSYFLTGALWVLGVLALGNLVSLFLAFPVLGKSAQSNPGQDFTTGLLYLGIAVGAAYLSRVPALTLVVWSGSVALVGRLLHRREAQLIAALH